MDGLQGLEIERKKLLIEENQENFLPKIDTSTTTPAQTKKSHNSWYYKDTLSSASSVSSKQQIESDAKKILPFSRDTLSSAREMIAAAIPEGTEKVSEVKNAFSPYYQDSIAPANSANSTQTFNLTKSSSIENSEIQDAEDAEDNEKDLRKFNASMKQFFQEIKEAEEAGELSFQDLISEAYRMQIAAQEDSSLYARERVITLREEKRKINQERLDKMEVVLRQAQSTRSWGKFESLASSFQLATAMFSANSPLGVAVFLLALGNVIDQGLDNPAKKWLANLCAWGNRESSEWWESAIQMGVIFATFGVSLASIRSSAIKAGSDGQQIIEKLFKATSAAMKTVAGGMEGWTRYQHNDSQKEMYRLTNDGTEKDDKLKSALKEIQTLISQQHSLIRDLKEIHQKETETTGSFFR